MCTICVHGSPGMGLQTVKSHHMGIGNQTWVTHKTDKCSKLLQPCPPGLYVIEVNKVLVYPLLSVYYNRSHLYFSRLLVVIQDTVYLGGGMVLVHLKRCILL